jgi:hypothetical protein
LKNPILASHYACVRHVWVIYGPTQPAKGGSFLSSPHYSTTRLHPSLENVECLQLCRCRVAIIYYHQPPKDTMKKSEALFTPSFL